MSNEEYRLLKQEELAYRWCVSEATLERWRNTNIGPVYLKLGGAVRYSIEDVIAYELQNSSEEKLGTLP